MNVASVSPNHLAAKIVDNAAHRFDLAALRKPLGLSVLNQIVSSGGNFLLGVYLARTLTLENFGLYGIGYGICMLYVGVGNALILTQMIVNMPDQAEDKKEEYAATMLTAVLLMGAFAVVSIAAAMFAAGWVLPGFARYFDHAMAIALAAVLLLCNEFFSCYAYLKRREGLALAVNVITMLVLFSGLFLAGFAHVAMSGGKALLLYAGSASVASGVAYLLSPLRLRWNFRLLRHSFVESWQHGRWALGGVGVSWVQAQTYAYALAAFVGPVAVGQANAARIFISPFSFLLAAINKVAMPRLADLRASNPHKMVLVSSLMTAALSALTILYSLILLGFLGTVSRILLGRDDATITALVWPWCLVLVFQMMRSGGAVLMQVQRKFRVLTLYTIPSAIVTLAVALGTIQWLGMKGAILGTAAGEIVLLILIWKEIRREQNIK